MNAEQILKDIKEGKPFSYPAFMNKKRVYTISVNFRSNNNVSYLVLSANNLKTKEVLTDAKALNIIENVLSTN